MTKFSSALLRRSVSMCAISFLALSLGACGGGGGGGSTPTPSGGTPAVTTPTPASFELELPDKVTTTIEENYASVNRGTNGKTFEESFSITVQDNTIEPTNFRLSGDDADPFQVTIEISATTNDEVVDALITIDTLVELDYEDPTDADTDNIYDFNLLFDYDGDTYTLPLEAIIENIKEGTPVVPGGINFPMDGVEAAKLIADITGDDREDLLISSSLPSVSFSVLSSQMLEAGLNGAPLTLGTGDEWANFVSSGTAGQHFDNMEVLDAADGTGKDVLFSGQLNDKIILYKTETADDLTLFEGTMDPTLDDVTKLTYTSVPASGDVFDSFGEPNSETQGRLIGDINGDGENDIFFSYLDKNNSVDLVPRFGFMWGEAITDPNNRDRNVVFDFEVELSGDLAGMLFLTSSVTTSTIPDIDGDNLPEFLIAAPAGGALTGFGGFAVLKSSFLANASNTSVDLSALTPDQGVLVRFPTVLDDLGSTVSVLPDFDNDGFETLVVSDSSSFFAIDLDDLNLLSGSVDEAAFLAGGAKQFIGAIDPEFGTQFSLGMTRVASDFDGDNIADIITRDVGTGSDSIYFLSSALVSQGMQSNEDIVSLVLDDIIYMSTSDQSGFNFTVDMLDLPASGLVSLPDDRRVVLLKLSDILTGFTADEGFLHWDSSL